VVQDRRIASIKVE